jgi:hypothetical protein
LGYSDSENDPAAFFFAIQGGLTVSERDRLDGE